MATPANSGRPAGWPSRLTKARLHFVTGKGGTGKSTIAASLALALAAGGRKVLLVEVEGRQGIAQLFDVPPLPYAEVKIATADGGGTVNALAIDTEAAFLEYLDMFYNLGLAGRAMRRIGAVEFATTIAPGLRDVLLTGKIKEIVVRSEKERTKGSKGKPTGYLRTETSFKNYVLTVEQRHVSKGNGGVLIAITGEDTRFFLNGALLVFVGAFADPPAVVHARLGEQYRDADEQAEVELG